LSLRHEHLGMEGQCVWCEIPIVAASSGLDGKVRVFRVAVSQAEIPQAEVPQAEVPQAEVPQAEVPQAEVPQAEVPQAEVPQAEVPQAEEDSWAPLPSFSPDVSSAESDVQGWPPVESIAPNSENSELPEPPASNDPAFPTETRSDAPSEFGELPADTDAPVPADSNPFLSAPDAPSSGAFPTFGDAPDDSALSSWPTDSNSDRFPGETASASNESPFGDWPNAEDSNEPAQPAKSQPPSPEPFPDAPVDDAPGSAPIPESSTPEADQLVESPFAMPAENAGAELPPNAPGEEDANLFSSPIEAPSAAAMATNEPTVMPEPAAPAPAAFENEAVDSAIESDQGGWPWPDSSAAAAPEVPPAAPQEPGSSPFANPIPPLPPTGEPQAPPPAPLEEAATETDAPNLENPFGGAPATPTAPNAGPDASSPFPRRTLLASAAPNLGDPPTTIVSGAEASQPAVSPPPFPDPSPEAPAQNPISAAINPPPPPTVETQTPTPAAAAKKPGKNGGSKTIVIGIIALALIFGAGAASFFLPNLIRNVEGSLEEQIDVGLPIVDPALAAPTKPLPDHPKIGGNETPQASNSGIPGRSPNRPN